jgi:hypothetical protein
LLALLSFFAEISVPPMAEGRFQTPTVDVRRGVDTFGTAAAGGTSAASAASTSSGLPSCSATVCGPAR